MFSERTKGGFANFPAYCSLPAEYSVIPAAS